MIAGRLPNPGAVQSLRKLGFTTVVLHHSLPALVARAQRFKAGVATQPNTSLRLLLESKNLTAYELLAAKRDPDGI